MRRFGLRDCCTAICALVWLLTGAVACQLTPNSAADAGVDVGSPDGAIDQAVPDQGVTGNLLVTVLKMDGVFVGDFTKEPMAGATVVADLPGGVRQALTTDADGAVEFQQVSWSAGSVTLTAYAPDYRLFTVMGITQEDEAPKLYMVPKTKPQTIQVTGTAKNLDPGGNYLLVGASVYNTFFEKYNASSFDLEVEADKPFHLLGLQVAWGQPANPRETQADLLGWTKVDHPGASSGPVTVDLDFADKLTPETMSGTIALPTAADNTVGAASRPWVTVHRKDSSSLVGLTSTTTEQSNGEFTFEGEVVKLAEDSEVFTRYYAFVGNYGFGSFVRVDGYPQPGATVGGFLDVPILTHPAKTTELLRPEESIEWKNPEPEAMPAVFIYDKENSVPLWVVIGKPGITALTLPQPPPGVTLTDLLGSRATAQVTLCTDLDPDDMFCRRSSSSTEFTIEPHAETVTITGGMVFDCESTGKALEGAEVCIVDHPEIPCATTNAKGSYQLDGVPNGEPVIITYELAGYLTGALYRDRYGATQIGICLAPDSLVSSWESALGFSLDSAQGQLRVLPSFKWGVTVQLEPAAGQGPFYFDTTKMPNTSLSASEGLWASYWNLPVGDYTVTATNKNGDACTVDRGWASVGDPTTARVTLLADTLSEFSFVCP